MAPNLQLVPGVAELRARESTNRALAFSGIARSLCGVTVRPLTPGARLELQLIGNAFTVSSVEPLEGDVFVFLWILSPKRDRRETLAARLANNARQWLLRRHVKRIAGNRLLLAAAVRAIKLFLVEQLQDLPEHNIGGTDFSPWVHWMAIDASWWTTKGGLSFEDYLRTPYLVLQQLYRGFQVNFPNMRINSRGEAEIEEPQFINASDRLIGEWHARHRAAAAEIIRSRTTRLD